MSKPLPESGRIYVLVDPETSAVRYCGKTVLSAKERLKTHLWTRPASLHRPLYQWITELMEQGKTPQIAVVQEVDFIGLDRWEQIKIIDHAERLWIAAFIESGAIMLNRTSGGNGAHGVKLSPERIEKLRQANLGRIKSPEVRKKISKSCKERGEAHYKRGMESEGWGDPKRWKDPQGRIEKIKDAWKSPTKLTNQRAHSIDVWASPKLKQEQSERHRGEKNARASITADLAKEVFLAEGSTRGLAKQYGITRNIVMSIKKRRSWKWLTESLGD